MAEESGKEWEWNRDGFGGIMEWSRTSYEVHTDDSTLNAAMNFDNHSRISYTRNKTYAKQSFKRTCFIKET